jgi:hypothetical protein
VLLVPFPEVAPGLQGLPAHVTLLFPFPQPSPEVIGGTRAALAGVEAFGVVFGEVRRFPNATYLAPEPAEPFARMTHALVRRFPGWPPYGGVHDEVIPHLTVALDEGLDEAEAEFTPQLPLHGRAREAVLLTEHSLDGWTPQMTFPFEGA